MICWELHLPFANTIHESSERTQSRIVLALDIENGDPQTIMEKCNGVLEDVVEYICAVKVNRQLVLSLGLPVVSQLVRNVHEHSLPVIMDETERYRPHECIHDAFIHTHRV